MSEQQAMKVKNDTLSILLCNRINSYMDNKHRALKIAKTCKIIRDKTKDKILYNACRSVIKATSNGAYVDVIKSIELTEYNYWLAYNEYSDA